MPITYCSMISCENPSGKSAARMDWEILIALEGKGIFTADGVSCQFERGTLICAAPGVDCTVQHGKGLRYICVLASDIIFAGETGVRVFSDDDGRSLEHIMRMIEETFSLKGEYYMDVASSLFDALQYLLLRQISPEKQSKNVKELINHIGENFSNPEYSISEAVDTMPFCRDYIRRQFKEEVGITPIAYLTQLRIDKAKRLLKVQTYTKSTVAEIAFKCGFYDSRYFSRLFKKHSGMTPREYIASSEQIAGSDSITA